MAQVAVEALDETEPAQRPRSPLGLALRRLLRKKIALAALLFIALFYFAGIFAPWVAPNSYTAQNLDAVEQGPVVSLRWNPWFDFDFSYRSDQWSRPLGTDRLGRDMLSRLMWAARTTVIVTVATLITGGLVLSVGLGLLSGYVGRWVDTLVMRVGDVFFALPGLPMLIMVNASLGDRVRGWGWLKTIEDSLRIDGFSDYFVVFAALSLFAWVGGARVIRSQVLALRETEYVLAARAMGASTWRIIGQHLLPNVSNVVIVGLSAGLGAIAGSEIALTWFGVGVQPPTPSFGAMLFEGGSIRTLQAHPHLLLVPGAVVALLIFSFNLLGDALNDVFTPRAR